jgi:hypothetical protein
VVSFYKLAALQQDKVKFEYLHRALQILLELRQTGKLPPANLGWIDAIQQELAEARDK